MDEGHGIGTAEWNDAMYRRHPTPYDKGVAGFIQSKRVKRVLQYAAIQPHETVLEIGCESGHLCAEVPPCARLVGCDISAQALADATKLLADAGKSAEFQQVDATQPLPFTPGEFDVVICSEMLEHVPEPAPVIANIAAICSPSTRVVLTVPIEAPKVVIKQWLSKLRLLDVLFPGIEEDQSEWHLQAFSPSRLRRLVAVDFICERSSMVWGCHFVALLHRRQGIAVAHRA